MMRGLVTKTLFETWLLTLLFATGLGLAMGLMAFIVPQIREGLDEVLSAMPFVRTLIQALMGSDLGDQITAQMMQSIVWVHPVVLSIVWAHEIVFCTRLPAGEIDRGTIDFLLGLPVSRRALYSCDSVAWLASGMFLLGIGFIGQQLGEQTMPVEMRSRPHQVLVIMLNLFCVYVAVGGLAYLASAISNHRGRAMGWVFSLLLASFLLNFLAQVWEPAKRLAFLSVLNYYRPASVLRFGEWPLYDMLVLVTVGGACWLAGFVAFMRRSICTV